MKRILCTLVLVCILSGVAEAKSVCDTKDCACSYRAQKKMLHNRKMIRNKVINAQVKGKMLAIQELSREDYCNNPEVKQKILAYQKQIEDLTNQKMCLKREYKASLSLLKASR